MTEEQTNQTPKQTEFTIQLPDREVQWEKCPVYVTKTKQVIHSTTEIIDGKETMDSDPVNVEYTEMAMEDTGEVDEAGNPQMQPIKLSDVSAKVDEAVTLHSSLSPVKGGATRVLSDSDLKKAALADAMAATFADEDGVIDDQALKEKATWGLGCPSDRCGGYREFAYADMVPQVYVCPVCKAKITLIKGA